MTAASIVNFDHVQIQHSGGTGILVNSFGYASIGDTTVELNSGSGVDIEGGGNVRIDRSVISVNGQYGVRANTPSQNWILRTAIQDNGQQNGNATEICACEFGSAVRMSDSAVYSGVSAFALETVTSSLIQLFSNNVIFGGQTGGGTIISTALR